MSTKSTNSTKSTKSTKSSTRKSPTASATLYKIGTKKKGNDGNIWIISEASNGVKRWKLYKKTASNKSASTKNSRRKKSSKRASVTNNRHVTKGMNSRGSTDDKDFAGIDPEKVSQFLKTVQNEKPFTKWYKKEKEEFITYQKLKNKLVFVPLTLGIVAKNINKRIDIYLANGEDPNGIFGPSQISNPSDRNNPKKVLMSSFTPNGDLYVHNYRAGTKKHYPNWIKERQIKIEPKQFLSLGGDYEFSEYGMQMCDPDRDDKSANRDNSRVLANNCMNSHAWVIKGMY